MSDQPPGPVGPVGVPTPATRATKAWRDVVATLAYKLPDELRRARKARLRMLRRKR